MRNFAFAALSSMVIATPAFAEDGAWTGLYGGITAGYNAAKSDSTVVLGGQWAAEPTATQTLVTTNFSTKQDVNGGNIGANIGYLYQTGNLVMGLEIEAASIGGNETRSSGLVTVSANQNYTFTNTIDPKSMVDVKVRLGAAISDKTLIYANAGWAWVSANHSAGVTGAYGLLVNGNYKKLGDLSKAHNGFIVGLGLEQKLDSHFSIRGQYEYSDQGHVSYTTAYLPNSILTSPAYSETVNQNLRLHLFRVGVSYHY